MALATVAAALVATACNGAGDPTTTTEAAPSGLSGSIAISGSSTVQPISRRVAEAFREANPDVVISVSGPGTGEGFAQFCQGATDVSDASRPISSSEAQACAVNGIEYVELEIAVDGISVLTNAAASFACLAVADLYALLGPESVGFVTWADANSLAIAVGAKYAPYPDVPLAVTGPGKESGTYDVFVAAIITGAAGGHDFAAERAPQWAALDPPIGEAAARPDYIDSASDEVIIEGIIGSGTSLGWTGYAAYTENLDEVKALGVDAGSGCIAPTAGTIADGSYPLSRPLFIYVNTSRAAEKPELAAFIDHYLSDAGLLEITNSGYIQPADIAAARSTWEGR
jgi:phosphate transport system substrate-binding protein